MSTTEHVLLESEVREVPDLRSARKLHARTELKSRLRQRTVQLEIIDYYYLSVRSWRSRTLLAEYVIDLRFVDSKPGMSRQVAWRWMTAALLLAALLLAALTSAAAAYIGPLPAWIWRGGWIATAIATALTALTCIYRTNETVTLYSAHGRAKLVELTGGLGSLRVMRLFLAKLAAHTRLAMAARRSSKAAHLRDEMREHFRLKEIGTLSVGEYEAAKARILVQHAAP